jgi:type IV pilus secretin PilQ/predicted competence protein
MRVDSRKLLPVGVLVLISTLAVNGATSKETGIVKDVSFSSSGDSLEARIVANDDSKFTYFELKDPHRLVIDFHGIQNTISFKEKKIDSAGVERVRTSFYSDRTRKATRIVFDLKNDVRYRVIEDGSGITRVVFGDTARAPENLTAGPVIVPSFLVERAAKVERAATPVEWALLAEPATPSIPARMPAARLESALLKPELLPPSPPPAAAVSTPVLSQPLPAPPAVSPLVADPPRQQTQVNVAPLTPPLVQTTPTATPQYTGEIATFELDNYPMRDFFRLISEISGLNVFLDDSVNGTITMTLKDVPWDQALDVVLKNKGLGGQLQGNILRITSNVTLQQEQTAQKALRDAQEAAAPLETRTYILSYTKAAEVKTILNDQTSTRGKIVVDIRRNALYITDVSTQFARLESMIKFSDTAQQQVDIEARLLSANKSFSRDLGNQIGLLIGANGGNVLTGLTGNPSPITRNPAPTLPITGSTVPLVSNFPAAATSGLSFFIKPGGDILLDEIIGVAEASGTAKLISRPHVTTQNNFPATIQQGTQIPVQTNVNNTITTQFISFALNLTVTPQITAAGTILLNVNVTNSQPDFARAVNGIPSVASQSATTQVLVPDGATAVIGGILVDNDSVNIRQVPGLGNLPLIGNLFKETNTVKSTAELLFFVTPRIKPVDSVTVLAPGVDLTPQGQPPQR